MAQHKGPNVTNRAVFYFTCKHIWNWNKIISATEIISKLFRRHWTCWKIFMRCNKLLK